VPAQAGWLIWTARRRLDNRSIAETAKPPNLICEGIHFLLLVLVLLLSDVAILVILVSKGGYFISISPTFGSIKD
jgi:hypothetical protein